MIDPGNSQEQKDVNEIDAAEESQQTERGTERTVAGEPQDTVTTTASDENPARRGKKRVKKVQQVTEEELMPRPSLWPLALAVSIAVALGGFAFNLIILGVGVIMVIVSVIGWSLERR